MIVFSLKTNWLPSYNFNKKYYGSTLIKNLEASIEKKVSNHFVFPNSPWFDPHDAIRFEITEETFKYLNLNTNI